MRLYVEYGGDVNSTAGERHDFRTVLHYAVMSGQQETVRYLVRSGARVNFPCDYEKPTPLDLAIIKGDVERVRLLIELGEWWRQSGASRVHRIRCFHEYVASKFVFTL